MKARMSTLLIVIALWTVSRGARLAAQDQSAKSKKTQHRRYKLIDTGTLDGATSSLGFEGERDINNRGVVVSLAETQIPDPTCFFAECFIGHAVSWQDGVLTLSQKPRRNLGISSGRSPS